MTWSIVQIESYSSCSARTMLLRITSGRASWRTLGIQTPIFTRLPPPEPRARQPRATRAAPPASYPSGAPAGPSGGDASAGLRLGRLRDGMSGADGRAGLAAAAPERAMAPVVEE